MTEDAKRSYPRTPDGRRAEIRTRATRSGLVGVARAAIVTWCLVALTVVVTWSGLSSGGLLLWAGAAAVVALLEFGQRMRPGEADRPGRAFIPTYAVPILGATAGLLWCALTIWAASAGSLDTLSITSLLLCCAMLGAVPTRCELPWAAELHIACAGLPALPVLLAHPAPQARILGVLLLACTVTALLVARSTANLRRRSLEDALHNEELGELIEQLHARSASSDAPERARLHPSPALDADATKPPPGPAVHLENERLVDGIEDGIVTTDDHGCVDYLNIAAQSLCGWREEALGRPLLDVVDLRDEGNEHALRQAVEAARRKDAHTTLDEDVRLRPRDSQRVTPVRISIRPRHVPGGATSGAIVTLRDHTELRSLAQFAEFPTTHDPLTGLINRREFMHRLAAAVQELTRSNDSGLLIYLGLDHLDTINDACGHPAGDQLLRDVAGKLQRQVTGQDTLARIGGGHFAALLPRRHRDQAMETGDALLKVVRQIRFPWVDRVFEVSASVGVALVGAHQGHYTEVLSAARAALHLARQQGGNRVHLYTPAEQELVVHHDLARWMERVQHAIEEGRFQLLVQPIEPLRSNNAGLAHGELLVRLLDEHGGLVAPHSFLRAAERYNLMPAVDRWVIRNSLAALARGAEALDGMNHYSINLSGQSLSDPEFLPFVTESLGRTTVDPAKLCFEITETAMIQNMDTAQRFMTALKELGCRFALDDFGSGLSSYGYLKNLSADYLKIDGSFVRGIVEDPTDRALVASINQVGHLLGMQTVAEHAETPDIVAVLREMDVDYAQGEAIGEPRLVQ